MSISRYSLRAKLGAPVLWTMTVALVSTLPGCGGEPRPPVDDPRSYAISALQTMDLNTWWQAYRNPDPVLLGKIVDEAAAKRPGGLPTDPVQLDTFIRNRIVPGYNLYMDDTEEGKAFILAQAEARFANPPMAFWDKNKSFALLDFYVLPGEWKSTTRVGEGLVDPPALGERPFLKTDILADSLKKLAAACPDARSYQIRYEYHQGSRLITVLMEFVPDMHIIYRVTGSDANFTREPVSWDELLNGRIDLAALKWDSPTEDNSGPPLTVPLNTPLPSTK